MTFSCWLLSVCRSLNLDPSKIVQPLSQSCIIAFLYEPNDERLLQCRCCLKLARGNSILELLMGHCARSWRKRMRFEIHDLLIFFPDIGIILPWPCSEVLPDDCCGIGCIWLIQVWRSRQERDSSESQI